MELNEEVKNEKEPKDGIALVKKYEDLLKGANKKIINIIGKQGEILKKFKKDGDFFICLGPSRSNIYFTKGYKNFYVNFRNQESQLSHQVILRVTSN